jgi:gliding motility-associated-like protein
MRERKLKKMKHVAVMFLLFIIFPLRSFASHYMAGQISYVCNGGNNYTITLKLYEDCHGVNFYDVEHILVASNTFPADSFYLPLLLLDTNDVSNICPTIPSLCQDSLSGNLFGVREWIFETTTTFSSLPQGNIYTLAHGGKSRNEHITTIVAPLNTGWYIYTTLDPNISPCNSSPHIQALPTSFLCRNESHILHENAFDADGDSLSYSLTECLDGDYGVVNLGSVQYLPPYNATNPLSSSTPIVFNPFSGEFSFTPDSFQVAIVALRIEEFRSGIKIGESLRDLQITIVDCDNNAPVVSFEGSTADTTIIANKKFCISFFATDSDTISEKNYLTLSAVSGVIPPAIFIQHSGNGNADGKLCWTPTCEYVREQPYVFTIVARDNACPVPAEVSVVYSIRVVPGNPEIIISGDTSICKGKSVRLRATGGKKYVWNTGDSTAVINVVPESTSTYSVIGSSLCGEDTAFITVVVYDSPQTNIAGDTVICQGETTVLTALGGNSYVWNTGDTSASIVVTPQNSTTYSVIAFIGSCSASASVHVSVFPFPVAAISGDSVLCEGEITSLTASGGDSYLWNTGDTTATILANPIDTMLYSVVVSNVCGNDTAFVSLDIHPIPIARILGDTLICFSESVTLIAIGGNSYQWNTGDTTDSIVVFPGDTTEYFVVASNGFCTDTAFITVKVLPLPNAEIYGDSSLCNGDSTILTAIGGANYLWSTGDTTQSIVVFPESTAIFSVRVFNEACYVTVVETIVVLNPPLAILSGDATICEGDIDTLNAFGGNIFLWNTGDTTSFIIVNPETTTIYSVIVSNSCGSDTAYLNVQVDFLPQITINGDTMICRGDSTTLTATGGITYSWSTGATTSFITVAPSDTTVYTVNAFNFCGNNNASVTVNVINAPNAKITGDNAICEGDSVSLFASGGTFYVWNTNDTSASISVQPMVTTIYSVVVSNDCFADTAFFTVNVSPLPVATISGDTNVCAGDSATLDAFGGDFYLWSTGDTTSSITLAPDETETFFVIAYNSCSSDTAFITVRVTQIPEVIITGNNSLCFGDSTILTASGGGNYLWSTGDTASSIRIKPNATTTYIVSVSNTCFSVIESVKVTVTLQPLATITGNVLLCEGESTTLNASGGVTYRWSTGQTLSSITVSPDSTTTFWVAAKNKCGSDTAYITVTVHHLPNVSILGDTNICAGESTTLTATSGYSYRWNTGATMQSVTVQPERTTSYFVIASNECGKDTAIILVVVTHVPVAFLEGDTAICEGETATLSVSGGETYRWNNGETDSIISVSPAISTSYFAVAFNACGNDTSFIVVNVLPISQPDFFISPNDILPNIPVTFIYSGSRKETIEHYFWDFGDGFSSTDSVPTHVFANGFEKVQVCLTVANTLGCERTFCKKYFVKTLLAIPNAFTPNNDGNNDYFTVYGNNIIELELKIFNQWGEMVFETKDVSLVNNNVKGWNGTKNGKHLDIGVYVYYCKATGSDGQTLEKTGNVTLLK